MTDQCPFLLRNHPSWRATTTLLLYVYARPRITPPPCSQRTRTTAPFLRTALLCRYLRRPSHPPLSPPRFPEREEDQEESAKGGETFRGGVKKRLPRHVETSVFPSGDFGRFSHRLYVSFHRCLYFLSFCRAFLLYLLLFSSCNAMNLQFDGSTLDKSLSLFSRNRIRYLAVSRTIFFILVSLCSSYDSKSSIERVITCVIKYPGRVIANRRNNHWDR